MINIFKKNVQIESTNICNFHCRFCHRDFLKVEKKHIKVADFKKVVHNISYVSNIDLTGWGEPTLHPNICSLIKIAKNKSKNVSLTTNGVNIDTSLLNNLIDSGLNRISISIDDIRSGKFSDHSAIKLSKFLQNIADYLDRVDVQIQITLLGQRKKDLFDLIQFINKFGISNFRLIRQDLRFNPNENIIDRDKEKKLFEYLIKKFRKTGVKIEMAQYRFGRNPLRSFFKIFYPIIFRVYCPKLINSYYVNVDGFLTPCCGIPKYTVGNLKKNPDKSILRSKKYKNFLKNQRRYCGNCEVLTW